jgi:K319L-like, PKD domain
MKKNGFYRELFKSLVLKYVIPVIIGFFCLSSSANVSEIFQLSDVQPVSSSSQYGALQFGQSVIMAVRSSTGDKYIKLNDDWELDVSFGNLGYLHIPSYLRGLQLKECGEKLYGALFNHNSSRYEVYRFHTDNVGQLELVATNNTLRSTGNGVDELFCIDEKIYVVVIDNRSPSTGTGIMLFNTQTDSIEIDIQVYDANQINGIIQDEAGDVWIHKSEMKELIKVDETLAPVPNTSISNTHYGRFSQSSHNTMTYVFPTGPNSMSAYIGSVAEFFEDLEDNGTLDGGNVSNFAIPGVVYRYPSLYGVALVNNKLALYYHNGPNNDAPKYTHYIGLYDIETGEHDEQFNGGEPLVLDSSSYNEYYHRYYTHLFSVNSNIYFALRDETPKLIIMEVLKGDMLPVAVAGNDQVLVQGDTVILDGSESRDPEGNSLAYQWRLVEAPKYSTAEIETPTAESTSITVDQPGDYIIALTVDDGLVSSAPSYVTFVALSSQEAIIRNLKQAISTLNGFDRSVFNKPNERSKFVNRLNNILNKITQEKYLKASGKLNKILHRTDGCAAVGEPDRKDWMIDCSAQGAVDPLIRHSIEFLGRLL